jgi:hypothetical protein
MVKIIVGVVAGVLLLGGGGTLAWYAYSHPSLRIVNTSGKDGVTVTLDGSPVAKDLKNAATESAGVVIKTSVASGPHKIEAKDASGKVLESFTYEFKGGTNGYVYAPARDPQMCFIVQSDEYKTSSTAPDSIKDRFKPLDPTKNIWELPESIDYWFQDSPESVTISQKKGSSSSKSVVKRALRQARCDDPEFRD